MLLENGSQMHVNIYIFTEAKFDTAHPAMQGRFYWVDLGPTNVAAGNCWRWCSGTESFLDPSLWNTAKPNKTSGFDVVFTAAPGMLLANEPDGNNWNSKTVCTVRFLLKLVLYGWIQGVHEVMITLFPYDGQNYMDRITTLTHRPSPHPSKLNIDLPPWPEVGSALWQNRYFLFFHRRNPFHRLQSKG
jgi:hypothetical protein